MAMKQITIEITSIETRKKIINILIKIGEVKKYIPKISVIKYLFLCNWHFLTINLNKKNNKMVIEFLCIYLWEKNLKSKEKRAKVITSMSNKIFNYK